MPTLSPRLELPVPLGTGDGSDVPFWFDAFADILDDAAIFTQGTLAQRPVSTVPAPGIEGRLHYVTGDGTAVNNGILWQDTGTGWVIISLTTWYRPSAGNVKTNDYLESAANVIGFHGAASQTQVGDVGGFPGILFGLAGDTDLYRSAANTLKTDDALQVVGVFNALGAATVTGKLRLGDATTPTTAQLEFVAGTTAAGGILFGTDTTLYRRAAGAIRSDGQIETGGAVLVDQANAQNRIYFGSALDTSIYRPSAGVLQLIGLLRINGGQIQLTGGSGGTAGDFTMNVGGASKEFSLVNQNGTGQVFFIPGGNGADEGRVGIRTTTPAGRLSIGANATGTTAAEGIYFGGDTTLYRVAATTLKTGDLFHAGNYVAAVAGAAIQVTLGGVGAGPGCTFGLAADTVIYRSAADVLKTDDSFHVALDFRHLGTNLGFFNHAAVARSAAYTLNAGAVSRNLPNGATAGQVEQALRQVITDLIAYGLLQ